VARQGDLRRRRRRRYAVVAVLSIATLTGGTAVVSWAYQFGPRSAAYRPVAAGPGHGRGMSQFGALDQATEGVPAERILLHYYPDATPATIGPATVRVRLLAGDDETLDVYSDAGLTVAGRRVIAGQAAHLTPLPGGSAAVVVTMGCAGEVLWQGSTGDPWAYPVDPDSDRPAAEQLQICGGGTYRGALGVTLEDGAARTVDQLDVEDYLMGVVPAEMPAGWADRGGAEALRAQAIAARSYALAEHRYPYAQTCDTTDCQAYPGTENEDPRATAAVRDTAGQVLLRDGRILRTEYSAAPGGGRPIDIATLDVGPMPAELSPPPTVPHPDGMQSVRGDTVTDRSPLSYPSATPGFATTGGR
jgi:hypothetical protein